ncbi:MAG: glycoside hydrolase family 15 protein [Azospirillaceae bacterium]|nr:glycoside hydrolase family 15 protein [Azospirillaceae bacterium]
MPDTNAASSLDTVPLAPDRDSPRPAYLQANLTSLAPYLFLEMMRNVTSDGYVVEDPVDRSQFSKPGCVLAAPSYPSNTPGVDQDYVFNWVRDAAITAIEIAAARLPATPGGGVGALIDYVTFARLCQQNATPTPAHAVFTVAGWSRPWSEQSDGPAIQTTALLQLYQQLDTATQPIAIQAINHNLDYLSGAYQNATTNLWEEHQGLSFFTRAVQLRCFQDVAANTIGITVPSWIAEAITGLQNALHDHWNGSCYVSILAPGAGPGVSAVAAEQGYDPNIDIVCAAVYGAASCTDTRLLATAGQLRRQWSDAEASTVFQINLDDQKRGIGPMMGRYPGDTYDGDTSDAIRGGHPWALCTANFAELYYRLANAIEAGQPVPLDELSEDFFAQIGISAGAAPATVSTALRAAGDQMLRAVVFHSDRYELSEQYDARTGYEKSVTNLTWSYAAFLSAVRARGPIGPGVR